MASLNRKEWEDMWTSIIQIERLADRAPDASLDWMVREEIRRSIHRRTSRIKDQIQSVIGQMEPQHRPAPSPRKKSPTALQLQRRLVKSFKR